MPLRTSLQKLEGNDKAFFKLFVQSELAADVLDSPLKRVHRGVSYTRERREDRVTRAVQEALREKGESEKLITQAEGFGQRLADYHRTAARAALGEEVKCVNHV